MHTTSATLYMVLWRRFSRATGINIHGPEHDGTDNLIGQCQRAGIKPGVVCMRAVVPLRLFVGRLVQGKANALFIRKQKGESMYVEMAQQFTTSDVESNTFIEAR
ncbi:hypothetical protein J1614_005289 [Plenodomus biglobosus]|nr:hypothetical protein J1614_005289 [Plenodomus biglobosus]